MRLAVLACTLGACASGPRVTDALADWRSGRKPAAIASARAELERFRVGNRVPQADIDLRLAEVDRVLGDETPILLPDDRPPDPFADPQHGPSLDRGLREDLAGTGATRTLRALRSVERLKLSRFSTDLFVVIWRREPWLADGPLLADDPTALRSLVVKRAALRALEAL